VKLDSERSLASMSEFEKTTTERQKVYGPYGDGIRCRQALMKVVRDSYKKQHGQEMPKHFEDYFWDIFNKIARLAITPIHLDSWHDLSNYAKLIEKDVKENY
jgi:hypothetical protein